MCACVRVCVDAYLGVGFGSVASIYQRFRFHYIPQDNVTALSRASIKSIRMPSLIDSAKPRPRDSAGTRARGHAGKRAKKKKADASGNHLALRHSRGFLFSFTLSELIITYVLATTILHRRLSVGALLSGHCVWISAISLDLRTTQLLKTRFFRGESNSLVLVRPCRCFVVQQAMRECTWESGTEHGAR